MKKPDLPYLNVFTDRHGVERCRFRRGELSRYLKGEIGSVEWHAEYTDALAWSEGRIAEAQPKKDVTIAEATEAWFRSTAVASLSPVTVSGYRSNLGAWLEAIGDFEIKHVDRPTVKRWIERRADKPSAANNLLKRVKAIFDFALDEGWIETNPAQGVKGYRVKGGYHSWTEEEIEQFAEHHEPGSAARLALALFVHTAQRLGDVARMPWNAIRAGEMDVRQQKTGRLLRVPLHSELRAILETTPRRATTILVTERGQPFSTPGLGNRVRKWCDAAGLPHCTAHGLRKASARRLADAGCSASQFMAVTGHRSLAVAQRYIEDADQPRLARAAILRLDRTGVNGEPD